MSDQLTGGDTWPLAPTEVPVSMRAVVFAEFGGPEVLHVEKVPTPEPGPGEVLVRVAAVSVGRLLDLAARAGTHPYASLVLPHVLGADHAGTVVAVGSGVESAKLGERVAVFPVLTCGRCEACVDGCSEACPTLRIIGVHLPGAYAEYVRVPALNAHPVPADLSPSSAAALALAGPVAMNQLTQAGLVPGDWVLVQGAASALGSLTATLAAHLGAHVIGTSRAAGKRERLVELGVTMALDPTGDRFVDDVLGVTGGAGVKIAVDDLGDPFVWSRTMAVLADRGTAVSSGAFLGGEVGLDLARLYSRCQRVLGIRTGNLASGRRLWREVGRGFRPVVDRTFPAAHAAQAHRHLEADRNLGRVALTTATEDDWGTG